MTVESIGAWVGLVGGSLGAIAIALQLNDRRATWRAGRKRHVRPDHVRHGAPPMPEALVGYRKIGPELAHNGRLFLTMPHIIPTFGATMNGCASRMWTARWRLANAESAAVVSKGAYNFEADSTRESPRDVVSQGAAGLAMGTGCDQPVFLLVDAGEGNLSDFVVQYQWWELAP